MKKTALFLSFCILISSLMFCGVTASAESNAWFDGSAMEVHYIANGADVPENGNVYLAAYKYRQLVGLSVGNAENGTLDMSVSVSAEPDTVKVLYFDENLKPIAKEKVFDSGDFKQPESEDAVSILKNNMYDFDENTGVLEYYESETSANTVTANVNLNGALYYNGAVMSGEDISYLGGMNNVFLNADIVTLSDCVNDVYNTVHITEYIFRGVSEVKLEEKFIRFSANGGVSLGLADRGNENFTYNIYDETGNALSLSDIKKNDVLSFVAPLYNGRVGELDKVPYMDIYVSDRIVTGEVERMDGYDICTINGERYWLDNRSYASVAVGDSGTFFITHNGIIYDYIPEPKDNFAIIAACGSTGTFETVHQLRLFTKDGELKDYNIASRVLVYDEIDYEYISNVYRRNDGSQDTFFAEFAEIWLADSEAYSEAVSKLSGRMVHYKLNEDSEICELHFAGAFTEEFHVQSFDGSRYYPDVQIFGGYDLDENSKLFVAPVTEVSTGRFNVAIEDMSVLPFAALDEEKISGYTAHMYTYYGNENLGAAIVCDEVADGFTLSGGIETFDIGKGTIIGYEKEGDTQTVEVYVDVDSLSVYYNDSVMTDAEIVRMGGLPEIIRNADSICFRRQSNQKYREIHITQYTKRVVTGIGSGIWLGDEEVYLTAEERGMDAFSYAIYNEDGEKIDLNSVSLYDIAYVAAPLYNGATEKFNEVPYLEMHIVRNVITGVVNGQTSDTVYTISGVDYESEIPLDIGGKYIFHLDKDNVICATEAVETIDRNYAFITRYGCATDFGETTYQLQLLTDDGELLTCDVASRLIVHQGTERNVYKSNDGTLNTFFAEIETLFTDEPNATAAQEKQGRRVVIFETNANDEICELWVADQNGDYYSHHMAAHYSSGDNSFGGFVVDDTSVIYIAPVSEVFTGAYNVDPDEVRVVPVALLPEDKTYNAHINIYDEDGYIGAAVTYDDISLIGTDAHLAVVTKYATTVDAENRDVMQCTFIEGGETKTINVAFGAEVTEMSVGDVFRYALDLNGEIIETQLILDASMAATGGTAGFDNYGLTYADWAANDIAIVYGKVTEIRTIKLLIDTVITYYTMNETEGNTYALVNCERSGNPVVKALSGPTYIQSDYNTVSEYFAVAILGEAGRYEDIVQVVFPESAV